MQFINNDKTNHPIKNNFAIERYIMYQSNINMHISVIYKCLYINRSIYQQLVRNIIIIFVVYHMMFICVCILAIGGKVVIFLHLYNH